MPQGTSRTPDVGRKVVEGDNFNSQLDVGGYLYFGINQTENYI